MVSRGGLLSKYAIAFAGMSLLLVAQTTPVQKEQKFVAALSPVSMDLAMREVITGQGTVSAVLKGNKLSISGSFEGLHFPAMGVRLYRGRLTGLRGDPVFDLMATHATSGTITGSLELNPAQIESLQKGEFYLQLDSEGARDGNLWGWLLRPEGIGRR